MNKEIRKLVSEIVFTIIFLLITIPVYINKNNEKEKLENINSLTVNKEESKLYKLDSNSRLVDIKEEIINIVNSYNPTEYELYLKYNKNSSTNIDNLKVRIDNKIYYLKELYLNEDNDNIYFLLDNSIINKEKKLLFNIWLEETNNDNSSIIYSLLIKKI